MFYNTPKRKMANILRKAANAITEYGWVKGYIGNIELGFCSLGAIDHVTDAYTTSEGWKCGVDTTTAFKTFLSVSSIPMWNDHRSRTKEEVLKDLRGCARWLEHGGVVV